MAIIERWYDQDLTKSVPTRMLGNLYYQDSDSVKLGVRVFSNGQPTALDGSITGYAVLSNGFTVPINTGVKSGNAASITLPPSVFSELGIVRITLKNTSGNVATTILSGVGVVVQTRTNDTVLPGQVVADWTNQITEAMQEVTDAANSVTSTIGNIIATPYDSLTFPVEVNTYTIRSGKLYRCKTRIETSEAWTSGHWVQVKVGNELSVLEPKAVSSDIGKVLKVKTVGNGKVTSYELGEAVVIDATLTQAGQAADAKAAGDQIRDLKSAIDSINDSIFEQYDLSTKQTDNLNISPTTDYWNKNNNISAYYFEIPEYAKALYLQSNLLNGSTFALLSASDTHTHNDSPVYATGSGRTVIEAGEKKEIVIPDDCKYLWVLNAYSNTSMLPEFIGFNKDIPKVDTTLSVSGNAADAKVTGDRINTIFHAITETEVVDIGSATSRTGLINVNNLWSTTSGFYSYAFNLDGEYFHLSLTASNLAVIGLLKNSHLVNQTTPPFCDGVDGRILVQPGVTVEIDIPDDCTYIVIMKEGDGIDHTPSSIAFSKWKVGSPIESNPLGLHETPRSESALNIVKRCRQMTDIKWTPAVDLPRYMRVQCSGEIPETAAVQNYLGTFKAGTEYTGIPYGRVSDTMDEYGYDYATAGHYIDFETFVSSVFNPKSKLCNENVGSVPLHKSVIYASVCSGLTCYALNVQEVPTARIANISGLETIGKINNNGVLLSDANFNIGDILNKYDYHTAIITDIIRDNEGNIQFVELADASTAGLADRNFSDGQIGGVCRRKGWTRDQLFDANSWGDYTLYRYTKNVPYTPSPYVNIGNEFNMQRIEHFPVMPYEGNKFVYKTGYIQNDAVKLVIALSGYSYLKVSKDGTEITGSPFAITNGTDDIDVTEVSVGEYSAYLCNITNGDVVNLSYPCHWSITA